MQKIKMAVFIYFKGLNLAFLVNVSLLSIILALGTYYLLQVNNLAITGYSIRDYENQIVELEEENHRLELVIAQKQSIYEVRSKVHVLALEPVGNLQYFRASDVARK